MTGLMIGRKEKDKAVPAWPEKIEENKLDHPTSLILPGNGRKICGTGSAGFTLLEIMIVISILGMLAGILSVRIMDKPGEARTLRARMEIQTLETALQLYKLHNQRFPTTQQGLRALVIKPEHRPVPSNWLEDGYLEKGILPRDPWGRDYLYLCPGVHNRDFDLWTYGADGEEGGSGEAGDVVNG